MLVFALRHTPLLLAASVGLAAAEPVNFSREVLPVLSDRCFSCHGPDEKHRKADLRLDVESAAKAVGENGAAIVPGAPEKSLLVERILSKDPDELMPPPEAHKDLTPAQIATLQRWIAEGAPWGKHWAFTPLERPVVKEPGNPVDALVGATLKLEGLDFSPEADPSTLLRRASLTLTGLPPTPEEMAVWLADTSPAAWEKQVDRLLASRAYGERMAWDWMEASRYADSNGYQGDSERTMWPWRDWVVNAFNRNMPWDEFTIWQLAGDLLPNATDEQKLATAFLRNHPINGEGGRIPEENRVDYVFDMTETTGTVWLGLTLNCCRCHDHKFDPLTNRDYYSLTAFFNQTPLTGESRDGQLPPVLRVPPADEPQRLAEVDKSLTEKREALAKAHVESSPRRPAWEEKFLADAAVDEWRPLRPQSARAEHSTLTAQPDDSLLNSGENPDKDSYEVVVVPGAGRWTGLRLEPLRDPSMTKGGLARSDNGSFFLTTLRVELPDGQSLPLTAVATTREQGDLKLAGVLDDAPATGWSVGDGKALERDHAAVLRFNTPLEATPDTKLIIRLKHESEQKRQSLGRFRLSLTRSENPRLDPTDLTLLAAIRTAEGQRTEDQRKAVTAAWEKADSVLTPLQNEITELEKRRNEIGQAGPKVMIMEDRDKPRPTFILNLGLYNKPGEEVPTAVPGFLETLPPEAPRNRLGLAQWIVSPGNPLTARVTVNRFWQMLFGTGLVKSSEDFGVQSEFPVHPALLDWLAAEFRDSGWNLKQLLRLILTSRTWKQSSRVTPALLERDPFNKLLARGPRFRLPSSMIRDQALAASGLLRPMDGGQPVNPYQPDGIWEETTFGNKKYNRSKGDDLHRRSLYTFWRRIVGPALFFDTGSRLVCSVKPLRTNTPLHALATTNDVTFVEAARALALATADKTDAGARANAMFERVLGHSASAEQMAVLLSGMERHRQRFAASPDRAVKFLGEGEVVPAEPERTPELAAWTMTALTILNMDETLNLE
ncbi:MAG: PSD1 and planctomycete cytochrome C domain-containing protein [Verrucomicrobiales bacterium]